MVHDANKSVGGYRKIRDLGMGSFGKAILVEHKETAKKFVMKAIDITRLGSKQREQSINEVKMLGSVKHPFIIGYRESFIINGFLCIITDYADGGDLYTAIIRQRHRGQPFPEKQVLRWLIQCLLALKHLHEKHILHRDVKSQNVFLSAQGRIRLGDFGIAKSLDTTNSFAKTMIGTPYYISPEMCKQNQPYSWASDIWALGCVLYEICALKIPFEAPNMKLLATKIIDGKPPTIPNYYSDKLREIFTRMLSKNPSQRPTANEILSEDFIQQECQLMLKEQTAVIADSSETTMKSSGESIASPLVCAGYPIPREYYGGGVVDFSRDYSNLPSPHAYNPHGGISSDGYLLDCGPHSPRGIPVMSPRGNPVMSTRGNPVMSTRGNPVMSPRGNPVMSPRGNTVMSTRGNPVMSPRANTVMSPRGEPIVSPRGVSHYPSRVAEKQLIYSKAKVDSGMSNRVEMDVFYGDDCCGDLYRSCRGSYKRGEDERFTFVRRILNRIRVKGL